MLSADAETWLSVTSNLWNTLLYFIRKGFYGWAQWLMPVFPATQEVEMGRIVVQGQQGQKVSEIPSQP
jgi:hypothetical protein